MFYSKCLYVKRILPHSQNINVNIVSIDIKRIFQKATNPGVIFKSIKLSVSVAGKWF